MKTKSILYSVVLAFLLGGFTACQDMLDVSSSSIQYEDKHDLNSAADSLYSVVGILSKLQAIGDRTVLLGELRGDLVVDNENTEKDLRELINHEVSATNVYNDYTDYYTVINNCNYYLDKVDTNVIVSNQKVMQKEVAVVKGIRAWTYMQLALIYKSVPFITEPIKTLQDAEKWDKECEYKDLKAMCDYFIPELLPYLDTDLPDYGTIGGYDSKTFFFPIPLLLGDMFLWMGHYQKAYTCYAYYAYRKQLRTSFHGVIGAGINPSTNDIAPPAVYVTTLNEYITLVSMASSKLYGVTSDLENIFSPTDINEGKRQVSPSRLWKELSEKQVFAYQQTPESAVRYLTCGDLRAVGTYLYEWTDGTPKPSYGGAEDWYVVDVDNKYKINSKFGGESLLAKKDAVSVYRVGNVFLRMAEALNRAGKPEDAFSILKEGVKEVKMSVAGEFSLEAPLLTEDAIVGIHSRGSGGSAKNEYYVIDYSDFDFTVNPDSVRESLDYTWGVMNDDTVKVDSVVRIRTYYGLDGMSDPNFANGRYGNLLTIADSTIAVGQGLGLDRTPDTIRYVYVPTAYLVDKVELMIVDEMAMETAFEGQRYYDLMRVAMRRESPAFLAEKVAHRNGEEEPINEALYQKLLNQENWYIHKQ